MEQNKLVQRVLDKCVELENLLNKDFLLRFAELHNIDPRKSKLSVKQEVLAKRALFFNVKKTYALHVINKEGKPTDMYDIKGFSVVKSDRASYSRENIKKLFDFVLKADVFSREHTIQTMLKMRNDAIELLATGNKIVGRPVSYKKGIDQYKKVPSVVLSMEFWNKIEKDYFRPGTKGYQFPLKGIDTFSAPDIIVEKIRKFGKLPNYITMPAELDKLPEYYIIDITKAIDFVWDMRVAELFDPIIDILGDYGRILKRLKRPKKKKDETT